MNKVMKLLVAIDDSDESFYALRWALQNFFLAPQAADQDPNTITLIHVKKPAFQPLIYPAGPGPVIVSTSMLTSVKKAQEEIAAKALSCALSICKEFQVKAETLIMEGDPKEKICDAAEQLHVDCVVLGSRGLGAIKRAFLGSVSSYCAHQLHCAVLIAKPPPKASHQ